MTALVETPAFGIIRLPVRPGVCAANHERAPLLDLGEPMVVTHMSETVTVPSDAPGCFPDMWVFLTLTTTLDGAPGDACSVGQALALGDVVRRLVDGVAGSTERD